MGDFVLFLGKMATVSVVVVVGIQLMSVSGLELFATKFSVIIGSFANKHVSFRGPRPFDLGEIDRLLVPPVKASNLLFLKVHITITIEVLF